MISFRKVKMSISKGNCYGQYFVTAHYKGKDITAHTTDSEAYDYLYDDSNKAKHLEAKQHCYYKIVEQYKLNN